MRTFIRRRAALLATAVAFILPFAIPSVALADRDAPDEVGVARISLVEGSVALQRGDADNTTTAAVINAPVLGGDYLNTGDASRAEVELDGGAFVRLGSNVQMRFTRLDRDRRAMQLAEGTIELRLARGADGRSEIDTPSIGVRPRSGGAYRVTVTGEGVSYVTVRSGDADVETPIGEQDLRSGTTLVAQGPSSNPAILRTVAISYDDFDRFNRERDVLYDRELGDQSHVDSDIAGTADLASYGSWVSDSTYGEVWVPDGVSPGWAPYRYGRWVWEDGFGWTWVGYERWGWAPYHYGAWYHSRRYGWCWYPPRRGRVVPLWRPAVVGFFTVGGGNSFGFGWVPLAPYERGYPWWGSRWGSRWGGNVNNGNVTRIYENAQYGVATVPGRRFAEGRFDHPTVLSANQLQNLKVVRGPLPVVPTTANLRYSESAVAPELATHAAITQGSFAGNLTPVHRMPFAQQRSSIAAATHLPLTTPVVHSYDSAPATTHHVEVIDGTQSHVVGPNRSDAWTRFSGLNGGTASIPVLVGNPAPQSTHPRPPTMTAPAHSFNATPHTVHTLDATPQTMRTFDSTPHTMRTFDAAPPAERIYSAPLRPMGPSAPMQVPAVGGGIPHR